MFGGFSNSIAGKELTQKCQSKLYLSSINSCRISIGNIQKKKPNWLGVLLLYIKIKKNKAFIFFIPTFFYAKIST